MPHISSVAGIDYSINSPCICVGPRHSIDFESCHFLVINDKPSKDLSKFKNIHHIEHPDWDCEEKRFDDNASLIVQFGNHFSMNYVFIEDYAMGARGRIFNIGENGGLLKHLLWTKQTPFSLIAPTVIKKFATGKGNAKKDAMWNQFVKDTGREDLYAAMLGTRKLDSPLTDIVDAFYIRRYGISMLP